MRRRDAVKLIAAAPIVGPSVLAYSPPANPCECLNDCIAFGGVFNRVLSDDELNWLRRRGDTGNMEAATIRLGGKFFGKESGP